MVQTINQTARDSKLLIIVIGAHSQAHSPTLSLPLSGTLSLSRVINTRMISRDWVRLPLLQIAPVEKLINANS